MGRLNRTLPEIKRGSLTTAYSKGIRGGSEQHWLQLGKVFFLWRLSDATVKSAVPSLVRASDQRGRLKRWGRRRAEPIPEKSKLKWSTCWRYRFLHEGQTNTSVTSPGAQVSSAAATRSHQRRRSWPATSSGAPASDADERQLHG